MKLKIIMLTVCLAFTSCASQRAGEMLNSAKKSYEVFQADYLNFSKTSLEREWILREALRKEALRVETENKSFTSVEAEKLATKYMAVYQNDIAHIEQLRNEHIKAMSNAKIGDDLVKAVIEYHKFGVQTEQVNKFLLEQAIPSITAIILHGQGVKAQDNLENKKENIEK